MLPGARTISQPGLVVTDPEARRSYLQAEGEPVRLRHCRNRLNLPTLDGSETPVTQFTEEATTGGYISDGEDWMSPMAEKLVMSGMECLANSDRACEQIVDTVLNWAQADALQTPVPRRSGSEDFDGVAWMANVVLTPMIVNYATARQLVEVDPADDAQIVDWLYDRANHYNFVVGHDGPEVDRFNKEARNHALAATMPIVALGSLIGDSAMLDKGIERWQAALSSMRDDGSFPTETQRGARSLHYTGAQLSHLHALAEMSRAQGVDLYDVAGSNGQTIHDAVAFAVQAWGDYDLVRDYAAVNHASPGSPDSPYATFFEGYFSWLPAYAERFPDHENIEAIRGTELDSVICSEGHIADGKSDDWWCSAAGKRPLTIPSMLHDQSTRFAVGSHWMGYMSGCFSSTMPNLLPVSAP